MNKINTVFRRFSKAIASSQSVKAKTAQKQQNSSELQTCFCLEEHCTVKPSGGCPTVVIIGAGMSGLSAGERLVSCGLNSISILEGSSRLGGRMMSCWVGDMAVELGCGCVIGGRSISSPLFNLALATGEGDIDKIYSVRSPGPTIFLTSEGNAIKDFEAEELLFDHILREAPNLSTKKISLLQFLSLRINQELLNYPEEDRYNAERLLYGMVNELRGSQGSELTHVSAPMIGMRKKILGPPVVVPHGIQSLLAPLLQVIPFSRLFQQKEVTKIQWKNEIIPGVPRVSVHTADWDTFEADYAIITLPIGVLKEKAKDLFEPPLPKNKLDAINTIGCGVMNKIYAEYAEPWWGGSGYCIRLALSPEEILQEGDWTRGISQIGAFSRTVMEIQTNGAESMMLEACTEEEIAMELTRFFRKLLCDNTIPFPNHIIATRWGTNQFCRGSFMSLTVDTKEDHIEELRTSVPETPAPALFFAGDYSDLSYFGTIDGARLSGLREANRIIQLTKQFDGPPKPC